MVFAQRAADHQHAVELRNVSDLHAQPRHAGAQCVGVEIGLARAKIDMRAADTAHEFLQQIKLFQRLVRRRERADLIGAVPIAHLPETAGNEFKRNLPIDLGPSAVLLDHRLREPRGGIQPFI